MNKTQILIALVIISLFGVISNYLDVTAMFAKANEPDPQKEVRDGEVRQYTKDQRLRTVVNYDNGIKHGTSYLYHDDGKTIMLAMPYNQGKREGTSKKYYENGKLYATTNYQNDLLHGTRELYYSNGSPKAVINYGNGNPGIGTVEYLLDGTKKEPNKIVATKNGNIIKLSTAEECRDLTFYVGKLIDDTYFETNHPGLQALTKFDGDYFIDISIYTTSYLQYQDVICFCESRQGNPIVLKTRLY